MTELVTSHSLLTGTLFHASRHDALIERFDPLSHFGTLDAALARASSASFKGKEDQAMVYEVELASERAWQVPDLTQDLHSWLKLADQLHYDCAILSALERDDVFRAAAPSGSNAAGGRAKLCEILRGQGVDSLVYENAHEDRGSLSWIVVDPKIVRIVAAHDLGAALSLSHAAMLRP